MDALNQKIINFVNETKSEAALVFNNGGSLKFSENFSHEDSVAAMSDAILSMCDKFLADIEKGNLKQAFLKTTTHVIVFNKIDDKSALVVTIGIGTNLGMFFHKVEELANSL